MAKSPANLLRSKNDRSASPGELRIRNAMFQAAIWINVVFGSASALGARLALPVFPEAVLFAPQMPAGLVLQGAGAVAALGAAVMAWRLRIREQLVTVGVVGMQCMIVVLVW